MPSHTEAQVPEPVHAERAMPLVFGWTVPLTGMHVPLLPRTSHAWHCPPHALLQQTPSTQLPEPHWLPAVHAWPLSARQLPSDEP